MSDGRRLLLPDIGNKVSAAMAPELAVGDRHKVKKEGGKNKGTTKFVSVTKSPTHNQSRVKPSKRRAKSGRKRHGRKGSAARKGSARFNRARGDPMRRRSAKQRLQKNQTNSSLPPLFNIMQSAYVSSGISDDNETIMDTEEVEPIPQEFSTNQSADIDSSWYLYQQRYNQSNGQVPSYLPSIRFTSQPTTISRPQAGLSSSSHVLPRLDIDDFRQSPPSRPNIYNTQQQHNCAIFPASSASFEATISSASMISEGDGDDVAQIFHQTTSDRVEDVLDLTTRRHGIIELDHSNIEDRKGLFNRNKRRRDDRTH